MGTTETETAAGPSATLEQVKAELTKVAEHNLLGADKANIIASKSGDAKGTGRKSWDTIRPTHFQRVLDKCEQALADAAAKAEAERQAQFRLDAVDVVGKKITELANSIKKSADAEAKALGEVEKHKSEGESFFKQLTDKLKEALPLAKAAGMTNKELKERYVGDRLGDTRFKLALKIAKGKTTHEEATEQQRTAKASQRAAAKAEKAAAQAETAPRSTGSAEMTDDQAKARMAALDGESQPAASTEPEHVEAPSVAPADAPPQPVELTPEEISDDALFRFKAMVTELCPLMNKTDLGRARVYLTEEKSWRPRVRRPAAAAA